jgi:hypothetical protein
VVRSFERHAAGQRVKGVSLIQRNPREVSGKSSAWALATSSSRRPSSSPTS